LKEIKKLLTKLIFRIIHSAYYRSLSNDDFKFKKVGENASFPNIMIIKNPQYISIGDNFQSLYNLRLEAWDSYAGERFNPEIIIGNNVSFNTDCHIGCINKVVLGNNVMIASRVYISDHSHGELSVVELSISPNERKLVSKGAVVIEDNVWIGEGACILPNVTIGANSVIGANAVVTKSFPKNSIIGGVPAKLIKEIV
jgi:acetyltransferase-like isoleucine patch superfamily enzyme